MKLIWKKHSKCINQSCAPSVIKFLLLQDLLKNKEGKVERFYARKNRGQTVPSWKWWILFMLLCADAFGLVHGTCRIFWLCALHVTRVLHIYCRKLGKKKGKRKRIGDFSGCPVGKTLPFKAVSIPSWGAKTPPASWPKKQNKPPNSHKTEATL